MLLGHTEVVRAAFPKHLSDGDMAQLTAVRRTVRDGMRSAPTALGQTETHAATAGIPTRRTFPDRPV